MISTISAALQERTVAEVKRLSLLDLEAPELLRRAARRLKSAIPFEAYCLGTFDPASHLMTQKVDWGYPSEEERVRAEPVALRSYFEEDLERFSAMLRERRPVLPRSEAAGGLERSFRFHEYLRPLGFGHELGAIFADGELWGGGHLMREAGAPDFSRAEVTLLKRVAPHIGAGLKAAALRSRSMADHTADDAPGVLTLDRAGRVISRTPAAERWLRDLDPAWPERGLPVAVRMVAGALDQALTTGFTGDLDLIPRLRSRARSGRWLVLHASLSTSSDGRPAERVIVVEPARPAEVAWLNVAAYGLSAREEEIVRHMVRGLSTRQVSATLSISEFTVQRHLQNAFEKVGVRSRRELLQRLFLESFLPDMAAGQGQGA